MLEGGEQEDVEGQGGHAAVVADNWADSSTFTSSTEKVSRKNAKKTHSKRSSKPKGSAVQNAKCVTEKCEGRSNSNSCVVGQERGEHDSAPKNAQKRQNNHRRLGRASEANKARVEKTSVPFKSRKMQLMEWIEHG